MKKICAIVPCLLIMCFLLFLTSCSSLRSQKDGPPPFDVDVSKISNPVPKCEPLSRIGNKPSYVAKGKRYYVMHSSYGYVERGIASWYGTKFYHRHTSNGEWYNMFAMTAAHRHLPLPTYIKVINLRNRRQVIVKVNDRGPFVSNRIIDLSYVAAKKLGMLSHGTAYVEIQSIDPRDNPEYKYKINRPQQYYILEVATVRTHARAMRLQARIEHLVSAPVHVELTSMLVHHYHQGYYRVKVGPIKMREATHIASRLKAAHVAEGRVTYYRV